jgi:mannitol/fructose-specific phosphotransferase system IIA component (Ntr-type)
MIAECLSEDRIVLKLEAADFNEAVRLLSNRSGASDPSALCRKILEHEKMMTSCLGRGAALPRAQFDGFDHPVIVVGISAAGFKAPSLDRRPVSIVFLHVFPAAADGSKILSQSLRLLGDENFRSELLRVAAPADLIRVVARWEQP